MALQYGLIPVAGTSYVAWKTGTPTTRAVVIAVFISIVMDDVLFEDEEFGIPQLALSVALAAFIQGEVR